MIYDQFKYLYPPRPQFKIPPSDLIKYENGDYYAQIKYNGTACVVFTNGEELQVYNRHKQTLSKYSPFIPFKKFSPDGKWYVYAGEYLNKGQKGENGDIERDKFVIWDCLVYAGEYLVGKTFSERMAMIDARYPCYGMRVGEKYLESYDYLCSTTIEGVYKSPVYCAGFDFLYEDLIKTDLYEGVVLKKRDAKLTFGFQEKNNSEWQLKCRKENKLYHF